MYATAYENVYNKIWFEHYLASDDLAERTVLKQVLADIQEMIDEEYRMHEDFFDKVGLDD
jgi:hypothetical protein